jgi:hypothetical protein
VPQFNGLPPGSAPDPTSSTKPVGRDYDNDVNVTTRLGKSGTGLGAFKEGWDIGNDVFNMGTWSALYDEYKSRTAFYQATNLVDAYKSQNAIGDET